MEETTEDTTQVNIMKAARLSGVSDKTIRRAIQSGKLPVFRPKANVALINLSDLEHWRKRSADDTEQRLAMMGQRIQTLEDQLAAQATESERRIQSLEQYVERLTAQIALLQARKKPGLTELPAHLESLYGFIRKHYINSNEVRALIKMGAIHPVEGKWSTPTGRVEEALDEVGRREFWVQLHDHPEFLSCDDCPHMTQTDVQASKKRGSNGTL